MWRVDDDLNKDNSCSMMAKKKTCDLLTTKEKYKNNCSSKKKRVEAHKIKWGMFIEYFTHVPNDSSTKNVQKMYVTSFTKIPHVGLIKQIPWTVLIG
jgi:hypothetical protein